MDVPPRKLPPKQDVMNALLTESNVFVHLDPRKPGVIVPKWLQNQPELILQLGLNMPIPIPDLEVEDDGVSCTLSFSRAPYWCKMPWTAIFAIVSEKDRRGVVWPEDVPAESQLAKGTQKPPQRQRPKLTALGPNDRLDPEPGDDPAEADQASDDASADERDERPAPADAKCADCGTRWPEDQTSCAVCGGASWLSASEPKDGRATKSPEAKISSTGETAASRASSSEAPSSEAPSSEATSDAAPSSSGNGAPKRPSTRPTLVESEPGTKKKTTRTRTKTGDASKTDGTKKKTGPALVPDATKSGARSEGGLSVVAKAESDATPSSTGSGAAAASAVSTSRTSSSGSKTEAPSSPPEIPPPSDGAPSSAGDGSSGDGDDSGNKKPSKRPLPPYLRVVK